MGYFEKARWSIHDRPTSAWIPPVPRASASGYSRYDRACSSKISRWSPRNHSPPAWPKRWHATNEISSSFIFNIFSLCINRWFYVFYTKSDSRAFMLKLEEVESARNTRNTWQTCTDVIAWRSMCNVPSTERRERSWNLWARWITRMCPWIV